jgi:hypothetical protein
MPTLRSGGWEEYRDIYAGSSYIANDASDPYSNFCDISSDFDFPMDVIYRNHLAGEALQGCKTCAASESKRVKHLGALRF